MSKGPVKRENRYKAVNACSLGGRKRHNSAWIKIGLSVRIAQDLGLMMETDRPLPYAEQEERRRVFWSLFLLDRLVSCGRGRPPAILAYSCQLQLPCEEEAWRSNSWKKTASLDQISSRTLPSSDDLGPLAVVVIMAYMLSQCTQYMVQEYNIRRQDPPWDPRSEFASICSDLLYLDNHFLLSRPIKEIIEKIGITTSLIDQQVAGPSIFSCVLFCLCHCLLNHPFLLRRRLMLGGTTVPPSFLSRAFESGLDFSIRLTDMIHEARKAGCIVLGSFYAYCTVVAGAVLALHACSENESMRYRSRVSFDLCINYLDDVSSLWKNAASMVSAYVKDLSRHFTVRETYLDLEISTEEHIRSCI